jgi:hypothetical protein
LKVRGQRIEPAEVEAVLRAHSDIVDAVVAPRPDRNGENSVAAWVVPVSHDRSVQLWPSVGEYPVYDNFIYQGLANDRARNRWYREALAAVAPGRIVVDIGTGAEAILARLAVEAGARRVYAVEAQEEAYAAAVECIARAGLTDRISVLRGDARDIDFPERPDVCVSEIFESIAGAEGAGAIFAAVRPRLASACAMVPGQVMTMMAAVSLPEPLKVAPRFDPVAAYYVEKTFTAFGRPFDIRLCVRGASPTWLVSDVAVFEQLNLDGPAGGTARRVRLTVNRPGTVDGFLLWLRLTAPDGRVLDTLETVTSWFPAFVPAWDGTAVEPGDRIEADCRSSLSADGLHPDYELRAALCRTGKSDFRCRCDLAYRPSHFRRGSFYQQLFDPSGKPIQRHSVDGVELRRHVSRVLPDHMVPSTITFVDRLPLTPNGKVDYAALPDPALRRSDALGEYTPPANDDEQRMVEIWEEVLDMAPIGVRDGFFDLGGQSISAARVIDRVRHEFAVDLPLASLYREQTVRRLVQALSDSSCRLARGADPGGMRSAGDVTDVRLAPGHA